MSSPLPPSSNVLHTSSWSQKLITYHGKVPGLKKLPLSVVLIISLLILVNLLVWAAVGVVLRFHPTLISTAVLAYTLGLRHALDADHISAIDLMTRRLIASGQRPVTVGTFFSLGHSTIVIVTSIVVAATASAVSKRFDSFSTIGGIIGSSVSAAFLILLGIMNMYILYKLTVQLRRLINSPDAESSSHFQLQGAGCLYALLKKLFRLIDRPWKMYPLGVLFGLGFDTSSEIALLGISSIQAARGTSIWLILLFPVLFTAGMCMLDTADGALMMALYTSTVLARDGIAVTYYSIVLTGVTIVVAVVIGVIQLLTLVLNVAGPTGRFWDGVQSAGDHYDIIGGAICGSFLFFGLLGVLVYRPWRKRVDTYRESKGLIARDGPEGAGDGEESRHLEAEDRVGGYDNERTAAEIDNAGTAVGSSTLGDSGTTKCDMITVQLDKGI